MADRRMGDRRTPDKGTIVIQFKDAVISIVVATIIIISLSANIILIRKNIQYKQAIELYNWDDEYADYLDDEEDMEYEDIEDDEDDDNNVE